MEKRRYIKKKKYNKQDDYVVLLEKAREYVYTSNRVAVTRLELAWHLKISNTALTTKILSRDKNLEHYFIAARKYDSPLVDKIHQDFLRGEYSLANISKDYGVTRQNVDQLLRRIPCLFIMHKERPNPWKDQARKNVLRTEENRLNMALCTFANAYDTFIKWNFLEELTPSEHKRAARLKQEGWPMRVRKTRGTKTLEFTSESARVAYKKFLETGMIPYKILNQYLADEDYFDAICTEEPQPQESA